MRQNATNVFDFFCCFDEGLLKLFVDKGYSAFMVDYRGEWEDCELATVYPENVFYAKIFTLPSPVSLPKKLILSNLTPSTTFSHRVTG